MEREFDRESTGGMGLRSELVIGGGDVYRSGGWPRIRLRDGRKENAKSATVASQTRKRRRTKGGNRATTVTWYPTRPGTGAFMCKHEGYEPSIITVEGKLKGEM